MMSSNLSYCGENADHLHHHAHHNLQANGNSGSSSSGSSNGRRGNSTASNGSLCSVGMRCKTSMNYQPHGQLGDEARLRNGTAATGNDSVAAVAGGRYSPHPNELFLQHHGKLSMQPNNRYDDSLSCCLPPPSPAPNSDRYILGVMPPHNNNLCNSANGCSESGAGSCGVGGNGDAITGDGGGTLLTDSCGLLQTHTPTYSNYDCSDEASGQQQHKTGKSLAIMSTTVAVSHASQCIDENGSGGVDNHLPSSHKYANNMQQCSISPSTRYCLNERYREAATPKTLMLDSAVAGTTQSTNATRYVASTHHFLTQSTPMVSSDTYAYLSSTVHTPVKRYVPTPPPPNELYGTDVSGGPTTSTTTAALNKCTDNNSSVPQRLRLKCCSNEPVSGATQQSHSHAHQHQHQQSQQVPSPVYSGSDYYETPVRARACYSSNAGNVNCTVSSGTNTRKSTTASGKDSPVIILHDQQVQANSSSKYNSQILASSSVAVAAVSVSTSVTGGGIRLTGANTQRSPSTNGCVMNDFMSRTPSIEYINSSVVASNTTTRACTPVTHLEAAAGNSSNINSSLNASGNGSSNVSGNSSSSVTATTCLHCNTVRRTTGVHQTTQTTGPISPIPLQQVALDNSCLGGSCTPDQAVLTPASSESHTSSLTLTVGSGQQQRGKCDESGEALQHDDQMYAQRSQDQSRNPALELGTSSSANLTTGSGMSAGLGVRPPKQPQYQQLLPNPALELPQANTSQLTTVQQPMQSQQQQLKQQQHFSRKKRFSQYLYREIARFFGVDASTELEDYMLWQGRQRRLALRRFGALKSESEMHAETHGNAGARDFNGRNNCYGNNRSNSTTNGSQQQYYHQHQHHNHHHASERPDILPAHDTEDEDYTASSNGGYSTHRRNYMYADFQVEDQVERKASVASMLISSLTFIVHTLNRRQPRQHRQWSRSFAPAHVSSTQSMNAMSDISDGLNALQEDEVFFDSTGSEQQQQLNNSNAQQQPMAMSSNAMRSGMGNSTNSGNASGSGAINNVKMYEHHRQIYMGERLQGWRTSAIISNSSGNTVTQPPLEQVATSNLSAHQQQQQTVASIGYGAGAGQQHPAVETSRSITQGLQTHCTRGNRISAELLDGVLENARRPVQRRVKLFSVNDLDDRTDHRPFFTYWINTVQILVLLLSLICYGVGPIGIGLEQKTGQVLVTSLSLQTVQHTEQRNVWIGPRNNDLVHMGAKFATCMRSDIRIIEVLLKTRRQERETACCIRNDDSGCVQSSQADCSVRGLFPTKSISTWKKWSPGESGPGGRISGSVCGLDPKYCDAPASIAPYEWPDDITKWPICRKTNSFSQRFRYKDHTAEHMVCEVIGHPCCTGVYGECRITTREYCDFVNGYFHEEASLCSQISCLSNVCGMFPFFSVEVPDQFYRLFTSLCLHAGILHLAITIAFQHIFLADLERLIGPIRAAIVYIGSGLVGNLASAVLVPYKPEVGPLASLSGVVASLVVLLILMHWKQLRKPHIALLKLIFIAAILFGIGTLPWQLNFAGLLAGVICGVFLTTALVPFVSISKYGRKAKINLIWSCGIFHLFIYATMLVIFYVFPTELTALNIGGFLDNNFNPKLGDTSNVPDIDIGLSNNEIAGVNNVLSSTSFSGSRGAKQFYRHHYSTNLSPTGVNNIPKSMPASTALNQFPYHSGGNGNTSSTMSSRNSNQNMKSGVNIYNNNSSYNRKNNRNITSSATMTNYFFNNIKMFAYYHNDGHISGNGIIKSDYLDQISYERPNCSNSRENRNSKIRNTNIKNSSINQENSFEGLDASIAEAMPSGEDANVDAIADAENKNGKFYASLDEMKKISNNSYKKRNESISDNNHRQIGRLKENVTNAKNYKANNFSMLINNNHQRNKICNSTNNNINNSNNNNIIINNYDQSILVINSNKTSTSENSN